MEKVTTLNTNNKKIKSPKSKKDVIKETSKKIPNEKIVINDNSLVKNKNYKNELKDINNNKEFAKAIWDTDDITEAIKIEANNQEKLNNEIDENTYKNSFEREVAEILRELCYDVRAGVDLGGVNADLVVNNKFVIECDGMQDNVKTNIKNMKKQAVIERSL